MKILYLVHQYYPYYYTGTELLTDNLSRYQKFLGSESEVWAYNLQEPNINKINKTDYKGIPVTFFSHHNDDKQKDRRMYWGFKEKRKVFQKLLNESRPDIVHVTHSARMGDVISAAYDLGIPYITTVTDYWLLCPSATLIRKNGDLCLGAGADPKCLKLDQRNNKAEFDDRWNGVNNFLKNASRVGYAANFVRTMFENNGIDSSNWAHIRHGYNPNGKKKRLEENIFRFAFTGTLQPSKGAHVAIEAFKKVELPNSALAVYGEIGHDNGYSKYCLDLAKGDERIEFRGKYELNNLVEEFNDIDCILVPSVWYEPFPFTLINAITYGFDVIGTNIGGIPEIIGNENKESLFEVGNSSDLAEKMRENIIKGKETTGRIFYDQKIETEAFKYFQIYSLLEGIKL